MIDFIFASARIWDPILLYNEIPPPIENFIQYHIFPGKLIYQDSDMPSFQIYIYNIVACQAHPALDKIGPVVAPSFYF